MWWLLALALFVLAAAGAALWRFGPQGVRARVLSWVRRYRLRGGRVDPRYPVLLVHGFMGFDEVRLGKTNTEYFRGVRARLEGLGVEVHRVRLPAVASVEVRAKALAAYVQSVPGKRVNVIAHSMGGLDARYAIARLGLGKRIASLVTVATPHRGTPVADLSNDVLRKVGARWLCNAVGMRIDALEDLTSTRSSRFNEEVPDVRGVFYASVVVNGQTGLHPLLAPSHKWLRLRFGDNDGLVPVDSQAWGEVVERIDACHWGAVGWSAFDAGGFYVRLVRELRARGL